MMAFTRYLHERLEAGGFTTEDVLASVLPLVRQAAAAHAGGLVAPLQGINAIHVDKNQLWFEDASCQKPAYAGARLRELERLFPRWYDRQIIESSALGPALTVGEPVRTRSFEDTVRDYLGQELINHPDELRLAVLEKVEALLREVHE